MLDGNYPNMTRQSVLLRMTQLVAAGLLTMFSVRAFGELSLAGSPGAADFVLFDGKAPAPILIETNEPSAVVRAAGDLVKDIQRVTTVEPALVNQVPPKEKNLIIIGTLGDSQTVDQLAAAGKLDVTGIRGEWESYVLQIVKRPLPGVDRALVIAGSDRRGTIYGIYTLSEMIGVSPWYWWADVPIQKKTFVALRGDLLKQGPPAVKYRGIFLNDEDWGLRPWASKTFDPKTGNIGPKTYAKVFELLLRLRANYFWPAMHPGTRPFNYYPSDKALANDYGIVMGSSHCEQMLRDNISEWNPAVNGQYNFVTNPQGVLQYWEQRVRENGKYENIWTLGMRGISDSGMPGGGTPRQKAERLHTIITDQRKMLARWVNPDVAKVPQIFVPYKEVLALYRLMPNIPGDITLVWPDDNYGYIREFSNAKERQRGGGAGVYYHVSYWGRPHDYLWLCSTAPGLIAEEMTKAYDYGANRVWMLNVGDLKPAELDIEFFLKLAWNPRAWNGTNTYDLLEQQFARDFGPASAPELTSIMAAYYRLNFQRKPEFMPFSLDTFSPTLNGDEAERRLEAWQKLSARAVAVGKKLPSDMYDAFFELVGYPVEAAAAMNVKCLALDEYYNGINQDPAARLVQARKAQADITRLTYIYNNRIVGGKWRYMMSDDPRRQLKLKIPQTPSRGKQATARSWSAAAVTPLSNGDRSFNNSDTLSSSAAPKAVSQPLHSKTLPHSSNAPRFPGADFVEHNHCVIMEAEDASAFIPGKNAHWQKVIGVGYDGEAVTVFPRLVPVLDTPQQILSESPCLQYKFWIRHAGNWKVTVRSLPTFSVEAGKPRRYAIAVDDEPPQIVSLPLVLSENNHLWQKDVLRNAALTTSVHDIAKHGLHTLKIWMVDPGIVLDAIAITGDGAHTPLGYLWPPETRSTQGSE
jgi:Glycosyl hydrolase family 115/Gylcosyl hydrolase family 115 C-terminal domain